MERGLLKAVGLVSIDFYSSGLMAWGLDIVCLLVAFLSPSMVSGNFIEPYFKGILKSNEINVSQHG